MREVVPYLWRDQTCKWIVRERSKEDSLMQLYRRLVRMVPWSSLLLRSIYIRSFSMPKLCGTCPFTSFCLILKICNIDRAPNSSGIGPWSGFSDKSTHRIWERFERNGEKVPFRPWRVRLSWYTLPLLSQVMPFHVQTSVDSVQLLSASFGSLLCLSWKPKVPISLG